MTTEKQCKLIMSLAHQLNKTVNMTPIMQAPDQEASIVIKQLLNEVAEARATARAT